MSKIPIIISVIVAIIGIVLVVIKHKEPKRKRLILGLTIFSIVLINIVSPFFHYFRTEKPDTAVKEHIDKSTAMILSEIKKLKNPTQKEVQTEIELEVMQVQEEALKLYELGNLSYDRAHYETAIKHFQEALARVKVPSIHLALGNSYSSISSYEHAHINYIASIALYRKRDNKKGEASALGNIGLIYIDKGDLKNALKYFQDALKIETEIGNKRGEALTLGNIGLIYMIKEDLQNALKYLQDALMIFRGTGHKQGEALTLGNIGLIYTNKGDLKNALKYFQDALKIETEIGNKRGEASALGNIGLIYIDKGDLKNALKYLQDALMIFKEIGDKQGEAQTLRNIGLI